MTPNPTSRLALVCALAFALAGSVSAAPTLSAARSSVYVDPGFEAPAYQVRLSAPDGSISEQQVLAGEPIRFAPAHKGQWADGIYSFEITAITGMATRAADQQAKAGEAPSAAPEPATGSFSVTAGELYLPSSLLSRRDPGTRTAKDQVVADDEIIQGSECVGIDCVNNESFGFDTIRLKENNTRIKFDDTSSSSGFPNTDWQLTANDSASGGKNKFSIEDITSAKVPFTVEGAAPTNSLYIKSNGSLGVGTSTPVLQLHLNRNDTPAVRFEQNNSGGFTAQTWDMAGNEANFFVRDVTGGSKLPFRIRPGAPTSSIDIAASGNVGVGTAAPGARLHVFNGSAGMNQGWGAPDIAIFENTAGSNTSVQILSSPSQFGILAFTDTDKRSQAMLAYNHGTDELLLRVDGSTKNAISIPTSGQVNVNYGMNVTGNTTMNGNLTVTGTITPDYVFEKDFDLPTIDEHAEYMWQFKHLPAVDAAKIDGKGNGVINVNSRVQQLLEELEYAHVYIDQLHNQMSALEQRLEAQDAKLDRLLQTRDARGAER